MNQNQLTFESENLVVDYISFNIQGSVHITPIAKYFFKKFGFNSTIAIGWDGKEKPLFYDKTNQHQVSFRQHEYHPESKSFWVRTKINFSGNNAAQFYKLIQSQKLDLNSFQPYRLNLSRFDLCYFRERKFSDSKGDLEFFINKCCQKRFARSKKNIASYPLTAPILLGSIFPNFE